MQLEPPSLNIPLEPKKSKHLIAGFVGVCIAIAAISVFIDFGFFVWFLSACIIGLPVIFLLAFPNPLSAKLASLGDVGRVLSAALFVVYATLSKHLLIGSLALFLEQSFNLLFS